VPYGSGIAFQQNKIEEPFPADPKELAKPSEGDGRKVLLTEAAHGGRQFVDRETIGRLWALPFGEPTGDGRRQAFPSMREVKELKHLLKCDT
jgi:hypothetical protein